MGGISGVKVNGKDLRKLKDPSQLRELAEKIDDGSVPEDILDDEDAREAFRLGARALDLSSPVQKQYATAVRAKLSESRKRRADIERENSPGYEKFNIGKKLFEAGRYDSALRNLKEAMAVQPPLTKVGGEIQLYIAFTLDAMGKTKDACKVLKIIEDTHPSIKLCKQAEEIRFVMEAPVLKQPEKDLNFGFTANADRYRPRERKTRKPLKANYKPTATASEITVTEEKEMKDPVPEWLKNPAVIIILTAGVSAAAWQSAVLTAAQRAH
eukprot:CAMPEP_0184482094 /NCGR_PEP_ID=MMETSP0113_2-20130426/3663_1 /TAXON_ID=91329 /ORGANISM="Norrisiella sphaerica, Strain BC52" /LENGTH=268 /DNA_ID=CAMNT_0026861629 /DNA_START=256 /DNA_END=1061 /DNA_ORIENTATION=+